MKKYLLINNVNKLNEFCLHHGSKYDHPNHTCMRPCLEINFLGDESFEYIPGFIDIHENFNECPLGTIYVQLLYVKESSNYSQKTLEVKFNIFNKEFDLSRSIVWRKTTQKYGTGVINIIKINDLINQINSFIHSNYNFDLLTEENINRIPLYNSNYKSRYNDIIENINSIQILFYENSHSRVGKDDAFWKEVEINNLPTTNYFRNKITQILGEYTNLGNIMATENLITATYDYHTAFGPADGKKTGPYSSNILDYYIKDALKSHILPDFNFDKENLEIFYLELLNKKI